MEEDVAVGRVHRHPAATDTNVRANVAPFEALKIGLRAGDRCGWTESGDDHRDREEGHKLAGFHQSPAGFHQSPPLRCVAWLNKYDSTLISDSGL